MFKLIKLKSIHLFFALSLGIVSSCETKNEVASENKIIIKGSDSEVNLLRFLTEEFKQTHPELKFTIEGGGTSKGIESLINKETDIANASRLITEEELKRAKEKGVEPIPYIVASDAIAIITHPSVGVDSISLMQLSKILSGEIINWKYLGGDDLPIKIFGRNDNSGTKHFLQRTLNCNTFSTFHMNLNGNKEIIELVSLERGAIGYVNLGSIVNKEGKPTDKVWAMNLYIENTLSACSPYEMERIKNAEYPLTRTLIQYVNKNTANKVINFIQFELEEEQQIKLEKHGFFRINDYQRNLNLKHGFYF